MNRYAAALLSIAIVILTAFVAVPEGTQSPATIGQLVVLGCTAVVTYLVPLLDIRWAGILKTLTAVVGGVITALVPFWTAGHITTVQVAIVVLAALNAVAVEVGVQLRLDKQVVGTR